VNLIFEKLGRQFDREAFDCGVDSLNVFLKRYALQNFKRNLGVTIVAVGENSLSKILGYHTVSMAQVSFKEIPEELSGGIPRYPIPAMRIGRLAVDSSAQGMGLGGELLRDALFRALDLSKEVGTCVVLVDAIDGQAKRFYEKYGFIPLIDMPLSLVLPMKTIYAAWKSKG
jgi:GNAT superfamily N-acetyltransferase